MAHIIAVANRKGGVGKTTTSLNVVHGLRDAGKRVLLVDLDEQHNSTNQFGAEIEGVATVFDILTSRKIDPHESIQHHNTYGDIMPGDDLTVRAPELMVAIDCREFMLADALQSLNPEYDFVVLDCPPSLGIVTKNALIAANEVIVPMNCDDYSVEGFEKLMVQIDVVRSDRRLNPQLGLVRVLLANYDCRTRNARVRKSELAALAERYGAGAFHTTIRHCVRAEEAQKRRIALFEYASDCSTARDYRALVDELLGVKLKLNDEGRA